VAKSQRIIPFFLLFVTVSALSWSPRWGPALGAGAGGELLLSKEERFPLKPQAGGWLGLQFEVPVLSAGSVSFLLALHRTLASSLQGGFAYRGFSGLDSRLQLDWRWPLRALGRQLRLDLGGGLGAAARFDKYELTELSFFYPGLVLEPFLELRLARLQRHGLRASLPLTLYFRRDLETSASIGISLLWKIHPWAGVPEAAGKASR